MIKNYVKNMRRYLHMYPEISMHEYETTKKICKELCNMNINHHTIQNGRGVIAKISGNSNKKSIALRCEMDALPILEKNNVDYKSKNKNVMHACGHDANMAMALGTIKILKNKICDRNIYFVFQTDEEIARGSINYKKEQWYKNIDYIISLHANPDIKSGEYFVKKGNVIAGVEKFVINIEKENQKEITQKLEEYNNGKFYDDNYIKISLSKCIDNKILGNILYFDEKVLSNLKNILSIYLDIHFTTLTLPVINDDLLYYKAIKILYYMNLKNSYTDYIYGGEDFSYYLEEKKGLYVFLGTRDENKRFVNKLHSPYFDLDDDILYLGSLFCSNLIKSI